ncbi:MAG: ribonuclease J [Alphaproteobacteria bacterium]|nr:ribonuclease J [Alphaproteobacteria bacterium]
MKTQKKDPYRPPEDALWFLPLGGCGEIGMNLNLYGTAGKWLMVDCGVMFPDENAPGIEVITPDISFIAERRDDLLGMVITHGHEDHLGAIEYLWPQLRCPIYATKLTAEMIRSKLAQAGMKGQVKIVELPLGGGFDLGPFKGEMIPVTHSVPESHMVLITTQHGAVLHTGDWKFDADPIVGGLTDEARLKELGKENLLALVGDSTGALEPGHTGSEIIVQEGFRRLFGKMRTRIIVTCFSSSIARLKSICVAAEEHGRYVALVGRSLWRNAEIAEACGYLPEFSRFLSEHEAMQAPRDKIVMVCTGCQGEPRAALARIAAFNHPAVELDEKDIVIFSSREIPGNERAIARVQNQLLAQGIKALTWATEPVHVSGHSSQDDMARLYEWTRPRLAVPVHGELRHQTEHARIARKQQVPFSIIPANGEIIRLGPGLHEKVAEVPVGKLGLDGKVLRALDRDTIKHRRKMSYNGAAVITLALDPRGMAAQDPQVTLLGIEDEHRVGSLREEVIAEALDALEGMAKSARMDDAAVKLAVTKTIRRYLLEKHGKKPVLEVHVVRI